MTGLGDWVPGALLLWKSSYGKSDVALVTSATGDRARLMWSDGTTYEYTVDLSLRAVFWALWSPSSGAGVQP